MKIINMVVLSMLVMSLTGCSSANKEAASPENTQNISVTTNVKGNSEKTEYEPVAHTNTVSPGKEAGDSENAVTYTNSKLGFSIDFPKSWDGSYLVRDVNDKMIKVCFWGKSRFSKGFDEDTGAMEGTMMFFIAAKEALGESMDSARQIGIVKGNQYYYATGTDYPVGGIKDMMEMEKDEKEIGLLKEDYDKAKEMEKDVDSILKSFRTYQ